MSIGRLSLINPFSFVPRQYHYHDHHTSISISGRSICNLQFADYVGGSNRFGDIATANGMEVSTEKSDIMTNSTSNISVDIACGMEVSTEKSDIMTNSTSNISADIA